jgi:hypothetical protein
MEVFRQRTFANGAKSRGSLRGGISSKVESTVNQRNRRLQQQEINKLREINRKLKKH